VPDPPVHERAYRRDPEFGRRYVLGNLVYVIPAVIALVLCVKYFDVGGWRLEAALGAFLGCVIFGMVFDWFRFRNYHCPSCGRTIRKPTTEQFGFGTPICYYCSDCGIEWDTRLHTPSDIGG
jgi:hypothetical protein